MEIPVITPMLALYRSDQRAYQPTHTLPLQLENGDPKASLENLKTLVELKLVIQDIWVRCKLKRALIQFNTGEQYLALGLSNPEALALVATAAGFGDIDDLRMTCEDLAEDDEYDDKLPRETPQPE